MPNTEILLKALTETYREFLDPNSNKRSLFKKMLHQVLSVTESEYGFIGEVKLRNGLPMLKTYAITDISWNQETAEFYRKYEEQGMEFTNLETLFGYTLKTGEAVISNEPSKDPRSGGLPKGHPAMKHYMGLPVLDKNNIMIGMVGVANKPGGYVQEDVNYLEPILSLCSAFISSLKASEIKTFFSDTLESYRNAIDSHAIVSVTDVKGVITYVNQKFCDLSKYTAHELIGKTHKLVNSDYHTKEFFANLWDTILSGKIWRGEVRNRTKEGSLYWVDATIVPFLDEDKKPYQFVAIRTDITKLKEQERELNSFFRLSSDFLSISSVNGRLIKFSDSFPIAMGMTKDEMLRIPLRHLVHPDDHAISRKALERLAAGLKIVDFENRYLKKDGSVMVLSWQASLNSEDGLIYASANDITQKKENEESIIQSKIEIEKAKAKDNFLANMSHEIRTPLNAIIGFHSLLCKTSLNQEQANYTDIIGSALKNLSVIINDILDLSKIENDKLSLEKMPFRPELLCKQLIQMNLASAKNKNLKIMLSYDPEIPAIIVGDEVRLTQILMNLLSNSLKFTPKGSIELRVTAVDQNQEEVKILFAVKDTGIGIPEDKINIIFDRFTQAENYTTRVYGGTGLGLNIVKSLVELHRGHLHVKSELGKGSEFSFEIVYPKGNSLEDLEDSNPIQDKVSDLSGYRILLAEDNLHNQILAKTYLEKTNALVDVAGNGSIALEKLRKNSYDIVLMDVQMPLMDGLTTTEYIRLKMKSTIPIIGCSAHSLSSEKARCLEAGMNDYINKPYSESELISAVIRNTLFKRPKYSQDLSQALATVDKEATQAFNELKEELGISVSTLLFTELIKRLPRDIESLAELPAKDPDGQLERLAHNLSGSLGSLKLKTGHSLSKKIEDATRGKDNEKEINRLKTELQAYLQELLEATKEYLR